MSLAPAAGTFAAVDDVQPACRHAADVIRWYDGHLTTAPDELVTEEPLEIRVRGRSISVTMRTPGYDAELAAGFLLTEGVIAGPQDLRGIEPCPRNADGNVIDVLLAPTVAVDFGRLTRHVFASSSCGLCGKAAIAALAQQHTAITSNMRVPAAVIAALPQAMRAAQPTFDRTGGLHAAALFDAAGQLLVLREDVGRHNAVDKVLGHALLNNWLPLDRQILLVSGRVSFEIVQKALAAGVPIVTAVSAPSSLAVDLARAHGQTLIGFLRENRMNLYTHVQRVQFPVGPSCTHAT
jgi:FdhD protein